MMIVPLLSLGFMMKPERWSMISALVFRLIGKVARILHFMVQLLPFRRSQKPTLHPFGVALETETGWFR
jgi:hypothetical protein